MQESRLLIDIQDLKVQFNTVREQFMLLMVLTLY